MVGGFGRYPSYQFLADAAPVETISSSFSSRQIAWCPADEWPGYTIQASNTPSRITLGGQSFVAEEGGWNKMVERSRMSEDNGFCLGLDATNLMETHGAGNAVYLKIATWITNILSIS